MAASGAQKCPKSEKLDEAQALAKSCAGRPDFLPCDGLSICATHSHGKCFKLHWCCHLGWCHCELAFFNYYCCPASSLCGHILHHGPFAGRGRMKPAFETVSKRAGEQRVRACACTFLAL